MSNKSPFPKYDNPQLNRLMADLGEDFEAAIEGMHDHADAYVLLEMFRNQLERYGFDTAQANKIASNFNLNVPNNILSEKDIGNVAEEFAQYLATVKMSLCQYVDGDLATAIIENMDLHLNLEALR